MKPEDVPDDLLDLATEGWDRHAATAPFGAYTHEGIRRAILAAVLPANERQVRERVAGDRTPLRERLRDALETEPHLSVDDVVTTVMRLLAEQHGDLRERIAGALPCPSCQVGPGTPCLRADAGSAAPHRDRLDMADAVLPVVEAETAALRDTIERIRELTEQPYGAVYDLAADIRAEIAQPKETP